jgi:hypothetical protein
MSSSSPALAAIDARAVGGKPSSRGGAVTAYALVEGQPVVGLRWAETTRILVNPGTVLLCIWTRWHAAFMGVSHARLELAAGQSVGVEWKMPGWTFAAGRLAVADVGPPVAWATPVDVWAPKEIGPEMVRPPHPTYPLATVEGDP